MENIANNLEVTSDKILNLLKAQGAKTVADLAKILGLSSEGVRLHLVKMAETGLVKSISESKGVGRPILKWSLTEGGNARFPNAHDDLSIQLLQTIKSELGDFMLEKIVEKRGEEILHRYLEALKTCTTLEERISGFALIRRQEGYIADWEKEESGYLFIENHCPICAAATASPVLCKSEQNILKQVLGNGVEVNRVDHILNGDRRCAYRITHLNKAN
ncbi:helix-turn-helix transcriptional regulator [Adhaeribacter aquaticus]|uniref:helix-turn-helix transcriptional regulator n=1 Tax=Adhaeribacter aquaticus TaxID=299567 RepID=UPI00040E850C|nr:metalloregulator ArsR/SmtB family transcription factor [Adhaeribacter aquaticus]